MKCEVINDVEPSFQPIEITMVIESEEELVNLWHRLNNNTVAQSYTDLYGVYQLWGGKTEDFFTLLCEQVKKKGVRIKGYNISG